MATLIDKCILVKSINQDQNRIRDIWIKANAPALGFADTPDFLPLLYMQFKAKMHQYEKDFPYKDTYLIYIEDFLCGYILTSLEKGVLSIVDVAILPLYQGRGIGSWIIENSIVLAGEGVTMVKLAVLKNNTAKALYIKLGFILKSEDDLYLYLQKQPLLNTV